MTKRQRSGFFVLILLIVVVEILIQLYPKLIYEGNEVAFTPTEEALRLQVEANRETPATVITDRPLSNFNPNALDQEGFMALGFSHKQAASLIKYRYIVGGNFSSIEEFGEAYVISDKKLEELRPYIQLRAVAKNKVVDKKRPPNRTQYASNQTRIKPFNPNKLTHAQWVALGFSERQVEVIFNYKNALPNKQFTSIEQLHACYAINDYMFNKISPYIKLPTPRSVAAAPTTHSNISTPTTYNVNNMHENDWMTLGFDAAQAEGIVKYKEFKGAFGSLEDLESCSFISQEDIQRIKNRIVFE